MITLPAQTLGTLKRFLKDHRDVMFKFIMVEIQKGLDNGAERVELFQFGETKFVAACNCTEFPIILAQALSFFVDKEMYEEAATCRDLITKAKIENVIRPL